MAQVLNKYKKLDPKATVPAAKPVEKKATVEKPKAAPKEEPK